MSQTATSRQPGTSAEVADQVRSPVSVSDDADAESLTLLLQSIGPDRRVTARRSVAVRIAHVPTTRAGTPATIA